MAPTQHPLTAPVARQLIALLWLLPVVGCATSPLTTATVTEGRPLPIAVAGHAGGTVEGCPVVVGGSSWGGDPKVKRWHAESFILRDDRWVPGPSLPAPLSDAAYACDSTGLYVAGGVDGKTPSRRVFRLIDVSPTARWQPLAALPEPVEAAAGAILDGTLYLCGGFAGGEARNHLLALDLRDPAAGWSVRSPLPAPGRGYAALVATDSALYLFGGFTSPPYQTEVKIFSDVHRYAPGIDRWSRIEGLDLPGYAWTATSVGGGQIMLTGRVPRLNHVSDEILLLDLRTQTITSVGRLVVAGCCMPAIPVGRNRWLLPGGEPDTNRSRSDRSSIVELRRHP